MTVKEIMYFEKPGREHTDAVAQAVRSRCVELGIEHEVVASDSGATGLTFWEVLQGTGVVLVSVAEHAGYRGGDAPSLSSEKRREQEEKGINVLICAHALSGVARSISSTFGGVSHVEIIAHTLRLFGGPGIKVAVEVAVMAADAGLVPTDREIIAVGGETGVRVRQHLRIDRWTPETEITRTEGKR